MKTSGIIGVFGAGLVAVAACAALAGGDGAMMRAVRLQKFGGPEQLKVEQIAVPTPGAGEMLLRVDAAGVNPVDWKICEGMFKGFVTTPLTPGYDVAGVVESVGADVTAFKAGDEVFAYLALQRGGGYAEHVIVMADEAAAKPKGIDFVSAAGVPLAALTAWQAMFDTAGLNAGQTVLIQGGSGGVGHFAVQLAKARGAKVIATASAANQAFLKELGADVAIDYKAQKFEDVVKDVDVVLDTVGGDTQLRSMGVIKPGGMLVSIVQPPDQAKLKEHNIRGAVIMVKPNGNQLAGIGGLIGEGKVKPHVGATFALEDAAKAQERSKSGGVQGKIVLKVR